MDEELMHTSSSRERSESIKLRVENTMRWRWAKDKDGKDVSNSSSAFNTSKIILDTTK